MNAAQPRHRGRLLRVTGWLEERPGPSREPYLGHCVGDSKRRKSLKIRGFRDVGNLMRLLMLVMSLLAAGPGAAGAQTATVVAPAATVSGVTVINAGTYTAQSVSAPSRAGQLSPTGTVGTASNWHFVSNSTDVAGQVGTQFGIEFRIDGNPVGDGVTLHLVLNFPPQGIRNPNTGDMMHTANIAFPNLKIGALCLLGYGFDNAWEIVPGVWTEQIWYQDRMLAERTFTVSKPEQ
jgi:hypothetical protein